MDAQVPPTAPYSNVAAPPSHDRASTFCWGLVVGSVWGALLLLLYFTLSDPVCFGATRVTAACSATTSPTPLSRLPAASPYDGVPVVTVSPAPMSSDGNQNNNSSSSSSKCDVQSCGGPLSPCLLRLTWLAAAATVVAMSSGVVWYGFVVAKPRSVSPQPPPASGRGSPESEAIWYTSDDSPTTATGPCFAANSRCHTGSDYYYERLA